MDSGYQCVLQRLREERLRRGLAQRLLCYCMKMPQSHFSRAETGHKRFSYRQIEGLCTSGVDVLYVFTGRKAGLGQTFPGLSGAGSEETLCLLQVVYTLAGAVWPADRDKAAFGQIREQLGYMQWGSGNAGVPGSIFRYVRERCGYTQQKMAERLGVDIKKLRGLEKGERLPDSEMIWKLYSLFGISPAYILKDPGGLQGELWHVLGQLGEEDRRLVLQVLENVHELMQGS